MKKITLKIFLIAFSAIIASSCGKDEYKPLDEPFVHIMKDELSAVTVNSSANYIATYPLLVHLFLRDGLLRS